VIEKDLHYVWAHGGVIYCSYIAETMKVL
jgi:hypothetical protein